VVDSVWQVDPAAWAYLLATAGFGAFAAQLVIAQRGRRRTPWFLAMVVASALWAMATVVFSLTRLPLSWTIAHWLDAVRFGAALWFLVDVSANAAIAKTDPAHRRQRYFRLSGVGLLTLATLVVEAPDFAFNARAETISAAPFSLLLLRSVFGLVLVEQIYRRTHATSRWNVRPLCLGLGGMFLYDLIMYADALLYRGIEPNMFIGRAPAHTLVVPLLGLAAARNREWNFPVTVSRSLLAGSTALFASGAYLLAVAGIGYYVRDFGGSWGRAFELVLLFAAALAFGLVVLSGTFRSKVRVFVGKHFFSYRYDYREEWLKFTRSLAETGAGTTQQSCIRALSDLVESPAGALWLKQGHDHYAPVAMLNLSTVDNEPAGSSMIEFLRSTGWVIDIVEVKGKPSAYPSLQLPDWLSRLPNAWLVVGLPAHDELIGFVVLAQPRVELRLDWEVRDLLKTAGRQAASYLAMLQATEALIEARKFDAFNRMSAFVVHDLKNVIAQLQLLLRNAERHRGKPEFQRDMLATVEHAVGRMNHLMLQLRSGATPVASARLIDLGSVTRRIVAAREPQSTAAQAQIDGAVLVFGHDDRLERVIGHLLQNAFDASSDNPRVAVRVFRTDEEGVIEVADNGVGMSREFVRDRLFKPFETTKTMGMGIGAYESHQYVTSLGGRIDVESAPNAGTVVRVRLPLARHEQAAIAEESC